MPLRKVLTMNRAVLASLIALLVLLGAALAVIWLQRTPQPQADDAQSSAAPPAETPEKSTDSGTTPVYGYKIIRVYPHDPKAFTQGLVYYQGVLYEGTGIWGESTVRKVELGSGRVLQIYHLPPQYFGEGITLWQDRLIQLTWRSHRGFVYDRESFRLIREFSYPTEGWGITHDGERLIMSDGTATLHLLDPVTFEEIGEIEVRDGNLPVPYLNELEYVKDTIYANVWQSDRIAIISPETGQVLGWLELTGLLSEEDRAQGVDVLNGIAYDADGDRLFVTGKYWPKLFEIELVPLGN